MSSQSPEKVGVSRRQWLGWAARMAVAPVLARADSNCPCAQDSKDEPAAKNAKAADSSQKELRICADPDNLPFSNRNREGFEDKIAQMVAKDLGLPLNYDWLPQRMGFYRTALKTFDSNLVMAAPAGFEKALITEPYYRSTFVFVQRNGGSSSIRSFDDEALRTVRIGVQLTGGVNAPPTHALARRKIIDNVTGFPVFDETEGKPAERIIAAVAAGQIDVAIVWGAQAGYFAKRQSVPLDVTAVSPEQDKMGDAIMPFTFQICMALRRSDKELRSRINGIIAHRRAQIDRVLDDYAVLRLPLLPAAHGTAFGDKS